MKNKALFFILGNPRSGTSLLRVMLDSHSHIVSPPESGFLLWWHKKYKDWSLQDSKNDNKVEEYIADLKTSKKIETWNLDFVEIKKIISKELPSNYAQLSSLIYYSYGVNKKKYASAFGDKNNYYLNHIDEILKIYPNAYFIHLIRDGRDVACSYMDLKNLNTNSPYRPDLPSDIREIASAWLANNDKIERSLIKIKNDNKLLVKYENLILDTKNELSKICDFLGLNFDPGMLSYYEKSKEPDTTLDWKRKTLESPDKNNINKYLSMLSKTEILGFNSIAKEKLIQYGYEL